MRRALFLLPLALLAACGSKSADGSSPDEQRALNDAAARLDTSNTTADDQGNAQ